MALVVIDILQRRISEFAGSPSASRPTPAQVVSFRERAAAFESLETPPLTPTSYGIYAVSGDKLYELDLLPGRAPDIRIAISAATIQTPSRTSLPDGHVKFIVYRRDSATSAADRAEIRVVAKIAQEMNFDKSGKPANSKIEDTWLTFRMSRAQFPDNFPLGRRVRARGVLRCRRAVRSHSPKPS